MGAYIAAECENSVEIYLQNEVPVAVWELVGWMSRLYAGAIQEDVDSVVVSEDLGDEFRDGGLRGQVCGVDCAFSA